MNIQKKVKKIIKTKQEVKQKVKPNVKPKVKPKVKQEVKLKENPKVKQDYIGLYDKYIPNHPKRENVYKKFFKLFQKYYGISTNENENKNEETLYNLQYLALNIELGIFNHALDNCTIKEWNYMFQFKYVSRAVQLYSNLNNEHSLKNENLIRRLMDFDISVEELSTFTSSELFPERHQEILKLCEGYNDGAYVQQPKLQDRADGAFRCGKCKSWKTEYTEVQTRSAKIIGQKSTLQITSWLCYLKNSLNPGIKLTQIFNYILVLVN